MKIIDFLLEDHKKRSYFMVCIFSVLLIIELYYTWILGYHLGSCEEILDLLKFTSIEAVGKSFAGRIIINYLDYHNTETALKIILRSMSAINWSMLGIMLILITEKREFRLLLIQLSALLIVWAFLALMIGFAASSTNAHMVADRLHLLSTGLKILSSGIIILIVFLDAYNGIMHYWNK